jgi:hypothetical protein
MAAQRKTVHNASNVDRRISHSTAARSGAGRGAADKGLGAQWPTRRHHKLRFGVVTQVHHCVVQVSPCCCSPLPGCGRKHD